MAEASISVDQDQFICPICLDLLKDPVTIHCGHSFCMVCINGCWNQGDQTGIYRCPQCRETFTPRPVLCRNNVMAEVVEKLNNTELQVSAPAGPGDVECDFCTGRKHKALKSCLTCMVSYCETHLKPHLEHPALKKHKVVPASSNLQEKICSTHGKHLEMYCRTDQTCICYLCTKYEHKGHDSVSAAAEGTTKKNKLTDIQRKCRQTLQEKEKKLENVKEAINTLKSSAQAAVEDSERIFCELMLFIEKRRFEVIELIGVREKAELSQAEALLEQLEKEIADLKRRDDELEQFLHTEDHIHFLQNFQSLCGSSGSEDSSYNTDIQLTNRLFDGLRKSLSDLKERLKEFCNKEMKKVLHIDSRASEKDVRVDFAQQYSTDLPSERNLVPSVHSGIECDGCQMHPIKGPRFKCIDCADFDFCESCFKSCHHNPKHSFGRIDKPACRPSGNNAVVEIFRQSDFSALQSEVQLVTTVHPLIRCHSCGMSPIRGPRFKCLNCVNFDICKGCFETHPHICIHKFGCINEPGQTQKFQKM